MFRTGCIAAFLLTWAVSCSTPSEEGIREKTVRFKGVELYSWKSDDGSWMFSLMDGTNRLKSEDEIKSASSRCRGAEELGRAFSRLAVGEQVFWSRGLEYPAIKVQERILALAAEARVNLHKS